jgi:5-methyltetrahydrofolate corrinoid/iron sulfur protein methyltransferase
MIGEDADFTFEVIGEKINGFVPRTGKAITEKDADYIKEIAKAQSEAGADYLDCCPATNEGALETMKWMVDLIQEVTDTPIALDSPGADILLASMDFVNKPGILNSSTIAGKKNDQIFPAIAGTDWKVVVMLDDDNGIPPTADGRIEVFKRNLENAAQFGVKPEQLYFDPLVETLGTNGDSLLTFAKVCRAIKAEEPNCHITSGLSNISYGLPSRKHINMPFLTLAMEAGMDSGIIDPLNRDLMGVIYGTFALLGYDDFCMEYLDGYREEIFGILK